MIGSTYPNRAHLVWIQRTMVQMPDNVPRSIWWNNDDQVRFNKYVQLIFVHWKRS